MAIDPLIIFLLAIVGLQVVTVWLLVQYNPKKRKNVEVIAPGAYVLDSCTLIDGRIKAIAAAGFIQGELLIPQRVLLELQGLADTGDSYTRSRARFGLDVAKALQDMPNNKTQVIDDGFAETMPTDDALTAFAKQYNATLCTTDFNLNKVATAQRVPVANVNELAQAIRPIHLPGEIISVTLKQKGEGRDQAAGYLDTGGLVVVENGIRHIGATVQAKVTRMLQTEAGRMIFASYVATVTATKKHR